MSAEFNLAAMLAKLTEWQAAKAECVAVAHLFETEKRLRQELFPLAFPTPKEGTNTFLLPQDWELKAKLQIDRKVDKAALPAVLEAIRAQGYNPDPAIDYDPVLVLKQYRNFPPEITKMFDAALIIKPATTPAIELVPPKPAKEK